MSAAASGDASANGEMRPANFHRAERPPMAPNFLSQLTGSFAIPAAENPTVAMVEAAYHHQLDWRYINFEVQRDLLGDAVRSAKAMGWAGLASTIRFRTRSR